MRLGFAINQTISLRACVWLLSLKVAQPVGTVVLEMARSARLFPIPLLANGISIQSKNCRLPSTSWTERRDKTKCVSRLSICVSMVVTTVFPKSNTVRIPSKPIPVIPILAHLHSVADLPQVQALHLPPRWQGQKWPFKAPIKLIPIKRRLLAISAQRQRTRKLRRLMSTVIGFCIVDSSSTTAFSATC